jgi:hypothetical protein
LRTDLSPDGLPVLGVAEVENRTVLEDLVAMPLMKDRNIKLHTLILLIERGIDVGFVISGKIFQTKKQCFVSFGFSK